jgi:hypothetical protein
MIMMSSMMLKRILEQRFRSTWAAPAPEMPTFHIFQIVAPRRASKPAYRSIAVQQREGPRQPCRGMPRQTGSYAIAVLVWLRGLCAVSGFGISRRAGAEKANTCRGARANGQCSAPRNQQSLKRKYLRQHERNHKPAYGKPAGHPAAMPRHEQHVYEDGYAKCALRCRPIHKMNYYSA